MPPMPSPLICLPEDGNFRRWPSAKDASRRSSGLFQGNAAQCGLRGFLDLLFALRVPAPTRARESPLDRLTEFRQVLRLEGVRVAECESPVKKRLLNGDEQLGNGLRDAFLRDECFAFLARLVTPGQHHRAFGHVLRAA